MGFFIALIDLLLLVMVVSGIIRLFGLLFSRRLRQRFLQQPVLHVVWFCASLGLVALAWMMFNIDGGYVSPKAVARIRVKGLAMALYQYRVDFGAIPKGGNAEIMRALMGGNAKKSVYITLDKKSIPAGQYIDPWGTPYCIGQSQDGFPWVYSCGPDKVDNGGAPGSDDVVSW